MGASVGVCRGFHLGQPAAGRSLQASRVPLFQPLVTVIETVEGKCWVGCRVSLKQPLQIKAQECWNSCHISATNWRSITFHVSMRLWVSPLAFKSQLSSRRLTLLIFHLTVCNFGLATEVKVAVWTSHLPFEYICFEDLVCNCDYQIKKFCSHIKLLLDIEPIIECQLHRTVFFIRKHDASRIWDKSSFLIEWFKYSQRGEGKQFKEGLCISIRGSQSMIVNLNCFNCHILGVIILGYL